MSIPPFRGDGFRFSGDWHGQLILALDHAARRTSSPEVRNTVSELRALLEKHDECEHSVIVSADIPEGTDPQFVLDCIRDLLKEKGGSVELATPLSIVIKMTGRGTLKFVEGSAKDMLSRGIAVAQFIMSNEVSPPFRRAGIPNEQV